MHNARMTFVLVCLTFNANTSVLIESRIFVHCIFTILLCPLDPFSVKHAGYLPILVLTFTLKFSF